MIFSKTGEKKCERLFFGFLNDKMQLSKDKTVLEIGVGTGRLAVRTAPLCKGFYGIDISTETIKTAIRVPR
mgnify:CR=1 FL=1